MPRKGNRILSLILTIMILFLSSPAFADENPIKRFTDIPAGHWADQAIHDLRLLKITDGIGNNQFGLGLPIKRNEFVTFLTKLMQWELIQPEKGSFIDNQDTTQWYYGPIETALSKEVVLKDVDKFRPDDPMTREEMAVMIVRTLGYDTLAQQLTYLGSPFEDVSNYTGYITLAKDFGIITGVGDNKFNPDDTATREQAAAMMMRMYEKMNQPINELHAFYAIRSAHQAEKIKDLDSVSFGWSRLEYDNENKQAILNTTEKSNNEYAVPEGFSTPVNLAQKSNISTQLMIFVKEDTIYEAESGRNLPFVEYIVTRPEIRSQVVESIVKQVNRTSKDNVSVAFDGVVIDFENLRGASASQAFTLFLTELRKELDKNDKLLHVMVHPKRRPGQAYFDGYDYKTIGEIADKVILMAHDYYAKKLTDAEMQNGYTSTPLTPMDEIYYALKAITDKETGVQNLNKIWLQISFDAVQWKLKDGRITNQAPFNPDYEAIRKRLLMDVTPKYSNSYQNPYITFFDSRDGTDNVLWYEDSRSVQAKIKLAEMFGIQGISLWRLGNIPDYEEIDTKNLFLDMWQEILHSRRLSQESLSLN